MQTSQINSFDPNSAMKYLVSVIQVLSHARELPLGIDIVKKAARRITGADGAALILRDQDKCNYVDEDSIGPLWKGKRFPLTASSAAGPC